MKMDDKRFRVVGSRQDQSEERMSTTDLLAEIGRIYAVLDDLDEQRRSTGAFGGDLVT